MSHARRAGTRPLSAVSDTGRVGKYRPGHLGVRKIHNCMPRELKQIFAVSLDIIMSTYMRDSHMFTARPQSLNPFIKSI